MNDNDDDDDNDDRKKKEFESDYSELRVEIAQWGTCRQTYFVVIGALGPIPNSPRHLESLGIKPYVPRLQ